MDASEILVAFYQEECSFARHHEELRATVANMIIAVAGGGFGLIAFDQKIALDDLPLAIFITLLGAFGAVFGSKHYERVRLHLNRSRQYAAKIEELTPQTNIAALRETGTNANKTRFPRLFDLRLYRFWAALNLLISMLGLALIGTILAKQLSP